MKPTPEQIQAFVLESLQQPDESMRDWEKRIAKLPTWADLYGDSKQTGTLQESQGQIPA